MLTGLIRLRSLDLSSNKLTLIDGALETLITLEQLNLRSNALVAIAPDSFKVRIFPIQFIYFSRPICLVCYACLLYYENTAMSATQGNTEKRVDEKRAKGEE